MGSNFQAEYPPSTLLWGYRPPNGGYLGLNRGYLEGQGIFLCIAQLHMLEDAGFYGVRLLYRFAGLRSKQAGTRLIHKGTTYGLRR